MGDEEEKGQAVALHVATLEAKQHQRTINNTVQQLNRLGLLLPLVGTLLFLPLVVLRDSLAEARLAFVGLVAVSVSGLLLHFVWTEFLNNVRYKYAVVYPRLFALAGQQHWTTYLEYTVPRSLLSWLPAFLYNLVACAALVLIWGLYLFLPAKRSGWDLELGSLCGVGAAAVMALAAGSFVTLYTARVLERDIKFARGRKHYLPLPFTAVLELIPLKDGKRYMVKNELSVEIEEGAVAGLGKTLSVPRGFVTDLTSVPSPLWPLLPPWEVYGPAALVHDYLYSIPGEGSRKRADDAFLYLMRQLAVPRLKRGIIYWAVRLLGGPAKLAAERRPLLDEATQQRIIERFERGDLAEVR